MRMPGASSRRCTKSSCAPHRATCRRRCSASLRTLRTIQTWTLTRVRSRARRRPPSQPQRCSRTDDRCIFSKACDRCSGKSQLTSESSAVKRKRRQACSARPRCHQARTGAEARPQSLTTRSPKRPLNGRLSKMQMRVNLRDGEIALYQCRSWEIGHPPLRALQEQYRQHLPRQLWQPSSTSPSSLSRRLSCHPTASLPTMRASASSSNAGTSSRMTFTTGESQSLTFRRSRTSTTCQSTMVFTTRT
mmetsp:Transcript_15096/g.49506  ORF Transcript_15096/g.49506 Transcript_15096/m.49506 type:complete len:247 (-) Transcript_15096:935-1675(-)